MAEEDPIHTEDEMSIELTKEQKELIWNAAGEGTKKCAHCGRILPISMFYSSVANPYGKQSYDAICNYNANKDWEERKKLLAQKAEIDAKLAALDGES